MTVQRVLAEKGRDVFTIQPYRTMKEAIELLAAKGVGAAVVADAQMSVLGICPSATSCAFSLSKGQRRSRNRCRIS